MSLGRAVEDLLSRDTCTRLTLDPGTDPEGYPWGTYTSVGRMRGNWGTPSSVDRQAAARMDQTVQAVFASLQDANVGDRLIILRGHDWLITHVHETILHRRMFLVEVD